MYYTVLLTLGIFGALGLLIHFLKGQSGSTRSATSSGSTVQRYPAVSVRCFGMGCEAAREIKGQRFLSSEAPGIPLQDCSSPKCACRYTHHFDRRSGTFDRRRLLAMQKGGAEAGDNRDQREGRGRRASDWAAAYQLNQTFN